MRKAQLNTPRRDWKSVNKHEARVRLKFLSSDHWLRNDTDLLKQGRIHGNPVADGWAGAVMPKPLAIQKCDEWMDGPTDRRTDRPTDRHGKV